MCFMFNVHGAVRTPKLTFDARMRQPQSVYGRLKEKKTTYIRMINSIRQCNTFQYDTVRIAPCLFSRSMCFTQCVCVRVGGCVRRRAFECIGALLMGCLLHLRSFGNHFFHFFPFHSIVCQVICKFVWQS